MWWSGLIFGAKDTSKSPYAEAEIQSNAISIEATL